MRIHNYIRINVLIFCFFFMFLSCEKEEGPKTWAYYGETQCANPWDDLVNNRNTEDAVKEYLENHSIKVFDIKIITYSVGPFCNACFCPSGRGIEVYILENDKSKIEKLGFK